MEVNSVLVGLWDAFEHAVIYYYLLFIGLLVSEDLLYEFAGTTEILVLYLVSIIPAH